MKSFVTVIVCVSLLQGIWLSFSSGQDADCTTIHQQANCCSSSSGNGNNSCVYVNCSVKGQRVEGCYNTTGLASCDNATEAVDTCSNATTGASTAAPAEGGAGSNATTGASSAAPAEGGADNKTTQATTGGEGNGAAETTTVVAETTTGGGKLTMNDRYLFYFFLIVYSGNNATGTPTGQAEAVDCPSMNLNQTGCCAAGNSSACIFFNCTNAGNLNGTFCIAANSTPTCENSGTPSNNICAESPSGQNPTQAPTSGGSSGGQSFDTASFIGGIVLCAGILAIAYLGTKFYHSKQERNYESM
ncbi:hypothetical protein ACOMHN_029787 [Nucella lapillus]